MNDEKGTSLVIVNSKKGQELLKHINENVYIEKVDFEEAIFHNTSMSQSPSIEKQNLEIYHDIERLDMDGIVKNFLENNDK